MFLSLTDIIIVVIVLLIVIAILYFHVWKNRKDPCKGCPYAKNCTSKHCEEKEKNDTNNKHCSHCK